MLPRDVRMRQGRDFSATMRRGERARSGSVVTHIRGGCESTRIGFVVSKSVGQAVVRNRVKRRLRHIARELEFPNGAHVVVRALPLAAACDSARLDRDLRRSLTKAESRAGER